MKVTAKILALFLAMAMILCGCAAPKEAPAAAPDAPTASGKRYVYAIGGNPDAATLAGVPVARIKNLCFCVCGVLTAASAVLLASRMNSGQPSAGDGFEFSVVSAVVLGGVSLSGGKGNVLGGVLGVLILSVLSNILTLMNVSTFYQQIARGVVILLAVYLDGRSSRMAQRKLLRQKLG